MKWTDSEDIGIALAEKFPGVDPLTIRFTDLRFAYPDEQRRPLRAPVDLDKDLHVLADWWGETQE